MSAKEMFEEKEGIYTYTQKIISQVVSKNDEATIKAIETYCRENNYYCNLIEEEKLKETIELGIRSKRLQQELSTEREKLKKIEEYIIHTNRIPQDKVVKEKILSIIKGDD